MISRETNRIILAWGPAAVPTLFKDRYLHHIDRPGCRQERADGYACWGDLDLDRTDVCWRHERHHQPEEDVAGARHASAVADQVRRWLDQGQVTGVYFIVAAGLVKIGKASDCRGRLTALQCGSPVKLTLHRIVVTFRNQDLETALHKMFAAARRHGEWFAAEAVLPFIDALSDDEIKAIAPESRIVIEGAPDLVAQWLGTPEGRQAAALVPLDIRAFGTLNGTLDASERRFDDLHGLPEAA